MAGSKGCHDDVAAAIIFVFNSLAMILSIVGIAGVSYIWYTQVTPEAGASKFTLSVFVPEAMLGLGIVVCLFVLTIALLGIITTGFEMRANRLARKKKEGKAPKKEVKKDKNGKEIPVKEPKGCCHNAGLLVYIGLCIFAFFFLLAAAVVAGIYSGKLDQVNYVSEAINKAKGTGDPWIDVLDTQVSNAALGLAKKYSKTWNESQTVLGCCGWNVTDTAANTSTTTFNHANVLAYTNATCCKGKPVVTTFTTDTGIKLDDRNCWVTEDKTAVYTCQGMVGQHMQSNMVKLCGCAVGFAILQLALAIAGCVVRFPRLYSYCACCCKKKAGKGKKVAAAEETPVQVL